MACTEFYTIRKKDGRFIFYDEVPGAMRGAYLIWHKLERKYLPSLPMEDWMVYEIDGGNMIIRYQSENLIKAIWYRLKHRDTSITRYPR